MGDKDQVDHKLVLDLLEEQPNDPIFFDQIKKFPMKPWWINWLDKISEPRDWSPPLLISYYEKKPLHTFNSYSHSCVTWDVTETNFGIPIMLHCLNQQYDPLVCQDWSMFISALFTAFQYFCNFTFRTITLWYDNSVSLTTLQMHGYLRIWNMFSKFCFTSQNSPVNRV